ncbi:Scr1 family TA system antitoxin-like transcriptional regulator [Sphaerisporangium sp. NPDC088356]|uniref:Scr1 family TA system antitoxin-like transcriptional regulator n=1 Tax=Sphaerisporangium sp. NPDC088356 TaxID=3154871 RepID=UPI0034241FF1
MVDLARGRLNDPGHDSDLDVVYLESQTGALYLEERAQVDRYNQVFDHLRAKALDPVDSRALIAQAARDIS